MSDPEDPFQRRDTRPYFGKTDRRESHRAPVESKVRPVPEEGEPGAFTELTGSISLNGFFLDDDQVDGDLKGKEIELVLDLAEEGTLEVTLPVKTPLGRPGYIVRLDSLDFEDARRIARFLDRHGTE